MYYFDEENLIYLHLLWQNKSAHCTSKTYLGDIFNELEDISSDISFSLDADEAEYNADLLEEFKDKIPTDIQGKIVDDKALCVDDIQTINDLYLEGEGFSLVIATSDDHKIRGFLDDYLTAFNKDELIPIAGSNYFVFDKQLEKVKDVLEKTTHKYGKRFNLKKADFFKRKDLKWDAFGENDKIEPESSYRIFDSLLFLEYKKHIKIHSIPSFHYPYFRDMGEGSFECHVELLKTLPEIEDADKHWIYYGALRMLKETGQAYYKNTSADFRSIENRNAKLLKALLLNPGRFIPIDELSSNRVLDNKELKDAKKELKELVKDLKNKLGITHDQERSLDIIIKGDSVALLPIPNY